MSAASGDGDGEDDGDGGPAVAGEGRLPDWLVIGAQKCGTTTVHEMLYRHPEVWPLPTKEAHFFAADPVRFGETARYASLFAEAPAGAKAGESTPEYLFSPLAPGRIASVFPHPPRMVAILRDPADRAYSQYWHMVRAGRVRGSFEDALAVELEGSGPNDATGGAYANVFTFVARGRYLEQLRRFDDTFGREPLLVLTLDELRADPALTLDRVADHLGVVRLGEGWGDLRVSNPAQRSLLPWRLRARTSWRPNVRWRRVVSGRTQRPFVPPPMDSATRRRLVEVFVEHNTALGEWLGRDLSGWNR